MKKLILPFLLTIVLGCAPQGLPEIPEVIQDLEHLIVYPADAKPAKSVSFQKDSVYGDSDEVIIGRIGNVAVDNLGRVFIADVGNMVILAFDPDGRVANGLGRDGRGPGEFSGHFKIQICGEQLYAFEGWMNNKLSVYDLDHLALNKTISLASNRRSFQALQRAMPFIDELYVKNDDTYLARFIADEYEEVLKWKNFERKGLIYKLDVNGDVNSEKIIEYVHAIHTHFTIRNAIIGIHLNPLFGHVMTVLSSENHIYIAEPDHFLVKVYSPNGEYLQAFYYSIKKIPLFKPLSQESAIESGIPELLTNDINSVDLPETWPVLTDLKIDDQDRLWIANTVEDMTIFEWWVLEKTGELITRFEWPRDEPIEVVKNGFMYTRQTDEETGLQQVVRYRVEFEEV